MFKRIFRRWTLATTNWNKGDHSELDEYLAEVIENLGSAKQCMARMYGPDNVTVKALTFALGSLATLRTANNYQMRKIVEVDLEALRLMKRTGRKVVDVELPNDELGESGRLV